MLLRLNRECFTRPGKRFLKRLKGAARGVLGLGCSSGAGGLLRLGDLVAEALAFLSEFTQLLHHKGLRGLVVDALLSGSVFCSGLSLQMVLLRCLQRCGKLAGLCEFSLQHGVSVLRGKGLGGNAVRTYLSPPLSASCAASCVNNSSLKLAGC